MSFIKQNQAACCSPIVSLFLLVPSYSRLFNQPIDFVADIRQVGKLIYGIFSIHCFGASGGKT